VRGTKHTNSLESQKHAYLFATLMMLFIQILLNKQALNIKEQKHWDGEMLVVISDLNAFFSPFLIKLIKVNIYGKSIYPLKSYIYANYI
jgi:hypothetical protein